VRVRPATGEDRLWVERFLAEHGSTQVARRGELVSPADHPMLVADVGGAPAGVLTYIVDGDECEVLTLHAVTPWQGAGTALIDAVRPIALAAGCRMLWVLTTNDSVDALRFYQRRGFRIRAVRPGAVDEARRDLKPEIPAIGDHGIPLRDEIELEQELAR
jgi:GNAT superfamily N-acetyltransferase